MVAKLSWQASTITNPSRQEGSANPTGERESPNRVQWTIDIHPTSPRPRKGHLKQANQLKTQRAGTSHATEETRRASESVRIASTDREGDEESVQRVTAGI